MSSKHKLVLASLALLLGGGVFVGTLVRAALFVPPEAEAPAALQAARGLSVSAEPRDHPERLLIPRIGVDAAVQSVGIAKSGNMAVPSNYSDTGWYRYCPAPGFRGSAVLDGHVDNGFALPGVFKRLNELKAGDEIIVRAQNGVERRFAVTGVQTYHYRDVPVDLVFNRADVARLNLVTCEGAWIAGEKTYDQRLVVYAVLQE